MQTHLRNIKKTRRHCGVCMCFYVIRLIVRRFVNLLLCAKGRFVYLTRDDDGAARNFIHVSNHYFSRVRIVCEFVTVQLPSSVAFQSNIYRYTCFSVHSSPLVSPFKQPNYISGPHLSARGIRIVPLPFGRQCTVTRCALRSPWTTRTWRSWSCC